MREKARQLRRDKDLTIDEIAERLAVSRTTVYFWVGDMPRPKRCLARKRVGHALGNAAMQKKYQRLRDEARELGRWEFPRLARCPSFRDFVCLYIAEGYKRSRNTVSLANSDAAVIKLADTWIRAFARNPVRYSVQHHADQRFDELADYWAVELEVPPAAIGFQRKSNSSQLKYRTWRSKHGVLTVRTGDTLLRARLQGWIDRIQQAWLDSPHGA
ncbi:MAG: HTH domain-containing protein [Solirubrobacterales bacterium]